MLDRNNTFISLAFFAIYILALSGCNNDRSQKNTVISESDSIPIYQNWPMNHDEMIERISVKSEEVRKIVENTKLTFYKNGTVVEERNGERSTYSFQIIDNTSNMAAVRLKDERINRNWYWVLWWNSNRLIVFGNPMVYVMDKP